MKFMATLFLGAGLLMSGAASAQKAKKEVYKVAAKQSTLAWVGAKVIGSQHNGTVDIKSGSISYAGDTPVGAQITVAMDTIKNQDLTDAKYNAKLVGHLKSDDFFGVDKHKEAKLKATKFKKLGKGEYEVTGTLTVKGKSHPVTFKATESEKKGGRVITADLTFDRTLFDVRYGSGKFFDNLGDKMISDEIKLKVTLHVDGKPVKTASN